ncbi:ATP-binding protein, partial [Pseudomonas syringae group genomosp. 3]
PVDASTEHLPGWRYTQPFVKIPNVLVTRLGEPAKTAIEELNGATLVVPDNPEFTQRLQRRVPDSLLLRVTDPADGFELVRTGKADGYVGNLITVDRLLEKGWSDSLKIAAATDLPLELSIAVTERHAQLAALLDQLIQSIPIEQRDLFAQQWLHNTYEIGVSPQRLWRIVGSIGAAALLIIGVLLYAHLSLKTRQRTLRETQQRLSAQLRFSRELLESYPYPVAIKDRQRRYLMLNKAYERTFNVESAQVLGRSVDEISYYPAQVRQRISKMVERALRDDERQQGEHILVGEDGSDQHWLYIVTPYRLDGAELQGVLTTFIDVTSIRAAEQLAEQAAEAKAAFLATMSHEIRTPMNGILGLLELMSDLHLPTDAQEMLTMVNESTRSLLQVLDDTLDFSRIDSGMLVIAPEPTDLRQLLDGVLRLIGHQAHSKGLGLHSLIDHRIAGLLEVDGSRLRQVLLNLLSNATKFTQSGHVRVELSVKQDDGQQHLEFLVTDTGIGISQEQQERLFQPFMQADSSITRRYGGSGLGLMISRRLVQLMGGELYLHSRLNKGTRITFTLSLPVVAALEKPFASHSVKLAPDLAPCREALAEHLLALGFHFTPDHQDLLITADEASAGAPGTLLVTTQDLPAGYAVGPSATRLSINPLTWGGLQAALEQLLLGRNSSRRIPLPRSSYTKNHKVLIVEDHPTNRLLLKRQMEHLQCTFDLVENGLHALERLQTQQYTLILTDCYMPELDGYAMTRQIRRSQLDAAMIPIIGMTASIHSQEQQRARAAGMDELILKPIVLNALISLFERYLCAPSVDSAVTSMGDLKAVMWDSFCEESRKDLLALEAALISEDAETLGHLLHKLAGALQLVELTDLASKAQHLHREAQRHLVVHAAIRDFAYQLRAAGV